MRRAGREAAKLGVVAFAALGLGAPAVSAGTTRAVRPRICIPLFGSCSTPTGSAPTVAVDNPTGITPSAATLGGRVDPEGLATSYQFVYAQSSGSGALSKTPARQLA